MATPDLVNLSCLIDGAKCFAFVRKQRWPEGCVALGVAAMRWSRTGATTRSRLLSGICARHVRLASMT